MSEHWERAVVDRIEVGQHAVLLVDDTDEKVVLANQLPEGAGAGTWLRVQFDGDQLLGVEIDVEESERVRARVREKMERLRRGGRKRSNGGVK